MRQTVELIDTLWNVNTTNPSPSIYFIKELIDTLWNVNNSTSIGYRKVL